MIVDIGSATSTTTTTATSEVSHPSPTSPAPAPASSAVADPITSSSTPAALQECVDVPEVEPVAEKVEDDQSNQDTPSETS